MMMMTYIYIWIDRKTQRKLCISEKEDSQENHIVMFYSKSCIIKMKINSLSKTDFTCKNLCKVYGIEYIHIFTPVLTGESTSNLLSFRKNFIWVQSFLSVKQIAIQSFEKPIYNFLKADLLHLIQTRQTFCETCQSDFPNRLFFQSDFILNFTYILRICICACEYIHIYI